MLFAAMSRALPHAYCHAPAFRHAMLIIPLMFHYSVMLLFTLAADYVIAYYFLSLPYAAIDFFFFRADVIADIIMPLLICCHTLPDAYAFTRPAATPHADAATPASYRHMRYAAMPPCHTLFFALRC